MNSKLRKHMYLFNPYLIPYKNTIRQHENSMTH